MQPDHIRFILETELDTEIWLKQQEKTQIEQEIARGEELIATLKRESALPTSKTNGSAPADEEEVPPSTSTTIIEMTIDGKQVQLACPECKRTAFFSLTGFVNHCRIVHGLVFLSPEERIERCGIPVQSSSSTSNSNNLNSEDTNDREDLSQITDHDSMLRQKLARIRAECAMNLPDKRPQIKCFDLEPIDLSLDPQRTYIPAFHSLELLPEESKEKDHLLQVPGDSRSTEHAQAPIIHTEINHQFATAQSEQESRFYIVKRIIVGNLVKTSEEGTGYRWKLYIRDEEGFLSKTLRKATFYLHSSYKPDDVVELVQYPFVLSRTGWGEFPVRIELEFHGIPKPIQVYYQLKLTPGRGSSKWVLGNERKYNIELEKISTALNVPIEHELLPLKEQLPQAKEPSNSTTTASSTSSNQRERKFLYCKFCGAQHLPLKSFVALQQACEYRLKIEHINSFTSFNFKALHAPIANRPPSTAGSLELGFFQRLLPRKRSNFRMNELVVECSKAGISVENQRPKMTPTAVDFVAEAGQSFLRELLGRAVAEAKECQTKARKNYPTDEPRAVLLTPVHLFNVLVGCEKFDFLTNKHLLSL
jgi:hypothetical protein